MIVLFGQFLKNGVACKNNKLYIIPRQLVDPQFTLILFPSGFEFIVVTFAPNDLNIFSPQDVAEPQHRSNTIGMSLRLDEFIVCRRICIYSSNKS